MRIDDCLATGQQANEQRARNVVRQIADQSHAPGTGQCREIKSQGIGLMNRQPCLRPGLAQASHQITVDLDRIEMTDPIEQLDRQCTKPGADLDETIFIARVDRVTDATEDRCVDQEMLTKSLARCMLHWSSRRYST